MFNNETAVEKALQTGAEKRVEVTVEGETAVVRMSSYAEGIGWFAQKTITLDADMLDAFADQIAAARGKIVRDGDSILSAEILEF